MPLLSLQALFLDSYETLQGRNVFTTQFSLQKIRNTILKLH